nr:hypothetical protein [Tanacetum cinerariifolium]
DNDVTRLQALVDNKKVVVTEAAIKEVLRRVGKGFFGVEIPLFEGMIVGQVIKEGGDAKKHVKDVTASDAAQGDDTAAHEEVLTVSQEPSIPSPTPPTPPPQPPQDLPSTSQEITKLKRRVKKLEKGNRVKVLKLQRLKRVGTSQRVDTSEDTVMDDSSNQGRIIDELDKEDDVALMDDKEEDKKEEEAKVVEDHQVQGRHAESQAKIYKINLDRALKVLSIQEDEPAKVQEVVDVVTTAKLITEVVTAATKIVNAAIAAAHRKRRKGVVIRDPEEESTTSSIIPADTKSKDKGKGIIIEKPKPLKKKQQVEMDEEYGRKLHVELNKDIDWDVAIDHVKQKAKEDPANVAGFRLDYFKGMSYDGIRLVFEAKFNSNIEFHLKTKDQMEEEESEALQSINSSKDKRANGRGREQSTTEHQ